MKLSKATVVMTSVALVVVSIAALAAFTHAAKTLPFEAPDRGVVIRLDEDNYTGRGYFGLNPLRPTIAYTPGRRSMVNPITLYPIFYGNWQDSDKAIVNDFLSGLGTSSFWNISTKYYNYNLTENGEPGPKKYVSSTVKLGKSASDPNRSLGTWLNSGNSSNFDDILAIVQNHIHSGELPADGDGIYLVLTDEETVEGDYCKSYCGWHTSLYSSIVFANGTFNSSLNLSAPDYIYAFIGNSKACGPNGIFSCGTNNFFVSPNGSPHIDQMLSPIAHEIAEAASNPDVTADTTAWNDVADGVNDGSENGDNCAYIFGSQAKHDHGGGYFYNQEWNGRKYFIQQLWDPDTQLCGPSLPSKIPSDCAKLQALLPNVYFGEDCCNSGFADCASGDVVGLDIRSLNISGSLHEFVLKINSNFGRLVSLYIGNNPFTGPFPDALCHQSQLQFLSASGLSMVTGPLPDCLGRLANLRYLSAHDNPNVSGPIPGSLANITELRAVRLSNNNHTGVLPDLSGLPRLSLLTAQGNPGLTGVLRSGYPGFPNGESTTHPGADNVPVRSCDLSGTQVCLPEGHVGPSCFIEKKC